MKASRVLALMFMAAAGVYVVLGMVDYATLMVAFAVSNQIEGISHDR